MMKKITHFEPVENPLYDERRQITWTREKILEWTRRKFEGKDPVFMQECERGDAERYSDFYLQSTDLDSLRPLFPCRHAIKEQQENIQ